MVEYEQWDWRWKRRRGGKLLGEKWLVRGKVAFPSIYLRDDVGDTYIPWSEYYAAAQIVLRDLTLNYIKLWFGPKQALTFLNDARSTAWSLAVRGWLWWGIAKTTDQLSKKPLDPTRNFSPALGDNFKTLPLSQRASRVRPVIPAVFRGAWESTKR